MAKNVSDGHMDGGLDATAASTNIAALSAAPAIYADIATYTLASTTMTGGDFTLANGDTSGRKVTVGAKSGVSISATGDATHVAVYDATDWTCTTCPTTSLTSGGTVDFSAWDREILDPI